MKILFFSDIHGIGESLDTLVKLDHKESFDKIIVLGDLYYNYSSKKSDVSYVRRVLESFGERLVVVKGNCDKPDEVSSFSSVHDVYSFTVDGISFHCTHGHLYHKHHPFSSSGIFIYGHEHTPYIEEVDGKIFINVGSISLPRKGYSPTYLVYSSSQFTLYDIEHHIIDSIKIEF